MANSEVFHDGVSGGSTGHPVTSLSKTVSGVVTPGNLRVVVIEVDLAKASVTLPTGFTEYIAVDDAGQCVIIADRIVAGGDSQTITCTFSAGATSAQMRIIEYTGNHATPRDGTSSANPGSVTTASPGAITPSGGGDALVVATVMKSAVSSPSVGSGFSLISQAQRGQVATKIKGGTDTAAENPAFTWVTAADAAVVMAAYKPATTGGSSGGGGPTGLTPLPYNPYNPLSVGLEWAPRWNPASGLSGDGIAWAERFVSSVAETIDSISIYAAAVPTSARIVAEVFQQGNEACGVETTDVYYPSADVINTNPIGGATWHNQVGTTATGTLYQSIDETSLDTTDYLEALGSAFGAAYACRMGSGAFASGRRPTQLRLVVDVGTNAGNSLRMRIRETATGAQWQSDPQSYYTAGEPLTFVLPEVNPFSGYPWSPAEVRNFASSYDVLFEHVTQLGFYSRVFKARLEVDSCVENRLATGFALFTAGVVGWKAISLRTPDGTDNWAKANGTPVSVSLRRVSDRNYPGGSVAWSYLDGIDHPCPKASHHAAYWLIDSKGRVDPLSGIDYPIPAFSLLLTRTDAAVSVDSQPYAVLGVADVVTGGAGAQQDLEMPVGAYGVVKARVKRLVGASKPLMAALRRRSDNGQVGTTAQLTAAEFDDLPDTGGGWKLFDVRMTAAAAITTAAGYRLGFSTDDTVGWQVSYLDTKGQGNTVGFGGTTDQATIAGVRSADRDLVATIQSIPASITGVIIEARQAGVGPLYGIGTTDYTRLVWDQSLLADQFAAYVVERWNEVSARWTPVARLAGVDRNGFHDFEARRRVATSWRVRVERIDGALSEPSAEVSTYAPGPGHVPALYLVSNERPDLAMVVVRANDWSEPWQFLDADRVALRPLFGRDGQVALAEAESRFDRFQAEVIVGLIEEDLTGDATTPLGRANFDRLLELSRAGLSYVCVLDAQGGRWFANLQVLDGQRDYPRYISNVRITELTRTPTTPDVVPFGPLPGPGDGGGGDPGTRKIGYIGYSITASTVESYTNLGGERFWPKLDIGGAGIPAWFDPTGANGCKGNLMWGEFDRAFSAQEPGLIWWQCGAHVIEDLGGGRTLGPWTPAELRDMIVTTLGFLRLRTQAPVQLTKMSTYADGTGVTVADTAGTAAAVDLVLALGLPGVSAGPTMPQLDSTTTLGGGNPHPNGAGQKMLGQALLDAYGATAP